MNERPRPILELPEWAQYLFADFLKVEMDNESTMFRCATQEDTHKAFEMMMRAYVAGYRDRTKGLRPVPQLGSHSEPRGTNGAKLRDPYPPEATKGPPSFPPRGPYHKGR